MGVESYLVLWVFTDECCHPNRFRVELMLIESFEIGRLDFPNRDTLESIHCFCGTLAVSGAGPNAFRCQQNGPLGIHSTAFVELTIHVTHSTTLLQLHSRHPRPRMDE